MRATTSRTGQAYKTLLSAHLLIDWVERVRKGLFYMFCNRIAVCEQIHQSGVACGSVRLYRFANLD